VVTGGKRCFCQETCVGGFALLVPILERTGERRAAIVHQPQMQAREIPPMQTLAAPRRFVEALPESVAFAT
jgi:hypothetical protein